MRGWDRLVLDEFKIATAIDLSLLSLSNQNKDHAQVSMKIALAGLRSLFRLSIEVGVQRESLSGIM